MPPKIKRKNNYKKTGELRRSQTITTFGSGAVVDFPRMSGIMAGIDSWRVNTLLEQKESKIHERNLEKMLGKEFFYQVSSPESESGFSFGIPVYRFPTMYYCPKCNRLDRYKNIRMSVNSNTSEYNSDLYCNVCSTAQHKIKLIPSRFVIACLNGHIEDFPYSWWIHKNKPMCDNPQLFLKYEGATGGLDSIHVWCKCGAHANMAGCMGQEAFKGLKCRGTMPWLGFDKASRGWYRDPDDCHAQLRVLQRSANNVYYSVNQSALTIPPWSTKVHAVMNRYNYILDDIFGEEDQEFMLIRLKKHYEKYVDEYKCEEETFINEAFKVYGDEDEDEGITEKTLRMEEYKAFCMGDRDEEYFKTQSADVPNDFEELISQIKLVKRLREVVVLQGFRRILPSYETDEDERKKLGVFDREFAPISRQPLNWLPAIELYGEGIFIQFKEDAIKNWEAKNFERYQEMADRLDYSWIGKEMFNADSPRFVFLHTFAHLLIRQLTAQCGYATASLKEKIYSTYTNTNYEMCGILIYTSATDTDGSLGGLVREGDSKRIKNTIKALLQEASWCSNDPICIESKSQGYKGLNYAACHACALLPETSCEVANCLLDRASVTGTPEEPNIAFFKDLI
jgi:hypothetical protein